ncbi:EAL domain-containing protein [Deinococcus altitudinis]|uniref:sensor domain-containing phosphodiesterase n=1 Tax=Deinococcus altitudinis TaxID=468914 RepID=UPI003891B28F
MTPPPDAGLGPFASLAEKLQEITEALAATSTMREVIEIVLTPAVEALGAVAGIVLLVYHTDQQMKIAGSQGYEDVTLTVWQEGPIEDHVLISDILRMKEALYFEHVGALKEAYPDLESRTGALAAVANAVLPMFLDDRPFGIIVLDFTEPHSFTPAERRFLRILSAQCAVALGRAEATVLLEVRVEERTRQLEEQTQRMEEQRAAQEAFVAFTEAVGSQTDLHTLVRQAITVLQSRFPGASIVYYEERDALWKGQVWSDDLRPELVVVISAGLPSDTPLFAEALRTQAPVFTDAWDAQREGVASSEEYGAAAMYPLLIDGELRRLLSIGLRNTRTWSEADRALLRSVGRSLDLALERTETARQLALQNAELQAHTRALEAFAELTRDLALNTDSLLLIRRAQEAVMPMLSEGAALYYELEREVWRNRVQHGNFHSPELQAAVDAGLPYAGTASLLIPWTTGQPYFQDVYDQDSDQLASVAGHVSATATLPLRVEGKLTGVLAFALLKRRTWSSVDRVVLETTVRSLELALDRAEYARQKEAQQFAVLEARSQAEQAAQETEWQRTQAETMQRLAHHDTLTGLLNRAGLSASLAQAVSAGSPFALFYLDLDSFKTVNDTLGHDAGDELLIQITAVLRREIRGAARERDQALARIGGDEFTVMVDGVLNEGQSAAIALRIRSALDQPFRVADQDVFMTASVGITLFPADGQTPEDLLKNADLAMYQIKRESKNGWRHYVPGMSQEAHAHLLLTSGLKGALSHDEFRLHYQPQIDLASGEVRCLEALLRWFPAGGEVVSPERFIPEAEASGLIVPIGQWVLDTACAQLAVWRKSGFPNLRVTVNVSPVQLARPEFVETVQSALNLAGLEASALELELTERGMLADLPAVQEQFRALRALGVQIALDDFGAGESNLGRLFQLPFDVLKLDRKLIATLDEQQEARRFLHALQVFASSLDLEVVAEGIETPGQLEVVRELGYHRGQGYLLGRPAARWPPPDADQRQEVDH